MKLEQLERLKECVPELQKMLKNGDITSEEYKNTLIHTNINGYTPLHTAACGKKLNLLALFVSQIMGCAFDIVNYEEAKKTSSDKGPILFFDKQDKAWLFSDMKLHQHFIVSSSPEKSITLSVEGQSIEFVKPNSEIMINFDRDIEIILKTLISCFHLKYGICKEGIERLTSIMLYNRQASGFEEEQAEKILATMLFYKGGMDKKYMPMARNDAKEKSKINNFLRSLRKSYTLRNIAKYEPYCHTRQVSSTFCGNTRSYTVQPLVKQKSEVSDAGACEILKQQMENKRPKRVVLRRRATSSEQ